MDASYKGGGFMAAALFFCQSKIGLASQMDFFID